MTLRCALTQKGILAAVKTGKPARMRDGAGLQLEIAGTSCQWFFEHRWNGKPRTMKIGDFPKTSLADAREEAGKLRLGVKAGIDPKAIVTPAAPAEVITFEQDMNSYYEREHRTWKASHAAGWKKLIEAHAGSLMTKATNEITDADVLALIEPMWLTKHVTADRVLCRIRAVIDLAIQLHPNRFKAPNPCLRARAMLPKGARPVVVNRPAMAWETLPAFYAQLEQDTGMDAMALRFLLLNGCPRVSEVIDATWAEITDDKWTIPAAHLKNGKRFGDRVNRQTPEALAILAAIKPVNAKPTDRIFPSPKTGKAMGDNAMLRLLNELDSTGATVHGFRTGFTGWCKINHRAMAEEREMLLDHKATGALGSAYDRETLLEERYELCRLWAAYLTSASAIQPAVVLAMAA